MASYNPPKKNTAYTMYLGLRSQADTKLFQTNPTLATGDVKVSKDGGSLANVTTLPTAVSSSAIVKLDLSSTEMNADNIAVIFSDASGAQWCDLLINLQTTARQFDDLASQASVDTIDDYVDTEMAAALAAVDTEVAAIKAKTDLIPASPAAVGSAMTLAADAVNSTSLAASAVTEMQSGLATAAALQTVDDLVDELETRLTALRAGYLDNLSGGAVATAAALATLAAYVDTEVAAILAAVDTEVAAIKAKTDNLPTDPADDSDIDTQLAALAAYLDTEIAAILAAVDTEVAAIKAKTDLIPASPAAVGSAMTLAADAVNSTSLAASAVAEIQSGLSTLSAAQVNAEVVDALATDTYAEPSSVPAATASLKDKIGFIHAALRNKRLTTATTDTIRNDADSAAIGAATLGDDGTTFTRGEYA